MRPLSFYKKAMELQKKYALPHFIFTIFIVKFLRSINRNAYQPVIFSEELAPFIGQHGSVGLDAVIDRKGTTDSDFKETFYQYLKLVRVFSLIILINIGVRRFFSFSLSNFAARRRAGA